MAYEVVMPYHLHMPSYFLETFTEYPYYGLELKNGVKGFETMESYIDSFIQYLNHPTL